jgi:hypothetical protein
MTSPNTLSAAITNAVRYELMNIHTAFPAKIVSYDFTTRKASVQPQVDKKYTDGTVQAMPQINNIPVIMPQVGEFFMNFPVNVGDPCLVICCERSISTWLRTGQQSPPADTRKLDLSDGVALLGLRPFTEQNPAANNTDFVIGFGGSEIRIHPDGAVEIKTASTVAIGTQLTELLDVVSQILSYIANPLGVVVPAVPFSGPLADAATAAALKIQLDAIKGSIT